MSKFHVFKTEIKEDTETLKKEIEYISAYMKSEGMTPIMKVKLLMKYLSRTCTSNKCKTLKPAYLKRNYSIFKEEQLNYNFMCEDCHTKIDEIYREM